MEDKDNLNTVENQGLLEKVLTQGFDALTEDEKKTYHRLEEEAKQMIFDQMPEDYRQEVLDTIPKNRNVDYYQGLLDGLTKANQLLNNVKAEMVGDVLTYPVERMGHLLIAISSYCIILESDFLPKKDGTNT